MHKHIHGLKRVKCEVSEKGFIGCERRDKSRCFRFNVQHAAAWPEGAQPHVVGCRLECPLPPAPLTKRTSYCQVLAANCVMNNIGMGCMLLTSYVYTPCFIFFLCS